MHKIIRRRVLVHISEEWTVSWVDDERAEAGTAPVEWTQMAPGTTLSGSTAREAPPTDPVGSGSQIISLSDEMEPLPNVIVLKRLADGLGWRYLTLAEAQDEFCSRR